MAATRGKTEMKVEGRFTLLAAAWVIDDET